METKSHLFEKLEVLLDWSISELRWHSIVSVLSHQFDRLSTNKSVALLNQLNCKFVEPIKIITCVCDFPGFVAHEFDIFLDIFNELDVFFQWICVIESQITFSRRDFGLHEVEPHGFAVTDVKVSVGLRWESGQNDFTEFLVSCIQNFFRVQC